MMTESENCSSQGGRRRYLIVKAAGSLFAIPATRIVKLLRSVRIFPIPGARKALLGLMQHNGEAVMVLDLAAFVSGERPTSGDPGLTIVVRAGQDNQVEGVALGIQDAVTVASLPEERLNIVNRGIVAAETLIDGELVKVLDLDVIGAQA